MDQQLATFLKAQMRPVCWDWRDGGDGRVGDVRHSSSLSFLRRRRARAKPPPPPPSAFPSTLGSPSFFQTLSFCLRRLAARPWRRCEVRGQFGQERLALRRVNPASLHPTGRSFPTVAGGGGGAAASGTGAESVDVDFTEIKQEPHQAG